MNFSVTAGPHSYVNCPLKMPIHIADLGYGEATLVDERNNRIACQLFNDKGTDSVAWIEPNLSVGEKKSYRLDTSPAGSVTRVDIEDIGEERLEVQIGGKLFTRYHYGDRWARPFLYPFIGPKDIPVTRAYPMESDVEGEATDHPHQKSVWTAYGKINNTDNWSEIGEHGYIRHRKFEEVTGGPIFGRVRAINSWVNYENAKQMEEVREFTIFNLESERIVDVRIKFIATDGDVCIGDTKEGGVLAVRVATSMNESKGGLITNAYGARTEAETWGRPAAWVDYSGLVGGETMGITVMDHPSSFRHPTRWHVRSYGLFAANPFALRDYDPGLGISGDYTIPNGECISFCYRVYIHEGDAEQAQSRERYFGFVAPPKIELT